MVMIKQRCLQCGIVCWHNPTKDGLRCTYCGHPPSTNPAKHPLQVAIRDRQIAKARGR